MTVLNFSPYTDAETQARTEQLFEVVLSNPENLNIALAILRQGVDLGATDLGGYTVLHWAAREGPLEAVQALLHHGADVDALDDGRDTPLSEAESFYNRKVIPALLAAGASVHKAGLFSPELKRHIAKWKPHYDDFCKGEYTPQTQAEWLGLASVMPLSDPKAYSSVADRVAQLMDWHKGLKTLRAQAASPAIGELGV